MVLLRLSRAQKKHMDSATKESICTRIASVYDPEVAVTEYEREQVTTFTAKSQIDLDLIQTIGLEQRGFEWTVTGNGRGMIVWRTTQGRKANVVIALASLLFGALYIGAVEAIRVGLIQLP